MHTKRRTTRTHTFVYRLYPIRYYGAAGAASSGDVRSGLNLVKIISSAVPSGLLVIASCIIINRLHNYAEICVQSIFTIPPQTK